MFSIPLYVTLAMTYGITWMSFQYFVNSFTMTNKTLKDKAMSYIAHIVLAVGCLLTIFIVLKRTETVFIQNLRKLLKL